MIKTKKINKAKKKKIIFRPIKVTVKCMDKMKRMI